jgi:ABC-type branched-subunit amino acid transport system permease subunit
VIWVAVGGRGTLVGAALGAVVVNFFKTVFTTGAARALLAVHARRRCSSS